MTNGALRAPFAVTATSTYRTDPRSNQDRASSLVVEGFPVGVVVCDGVGSWPDSHQAAEAAADAAVARAASTFGDTEGTWVAQCFRDAHRTVDQLPADIRGATTMLVVGVTSAHVHLAHLGNGALIETAAVPGTGSCPSVWWINHLLPHIDFQDGHEVLGQFVAAGRPHVSPTTVVLERRARPTVYLAATDGVLSRENNPTGRVGDGSLWESMPLPAVETIGAVRQIYELLGADGGPAPADLPLAVQGLLQETLDDLARRGELDDDATIGCVVV